MVGDRPKARRLSVSLVLATLSVRIGTSQRHTTLSADVLSRLNELEVMAASDGMVFDL